MAEKPKYFYSDWVAAEWMEKTFYMRFTVLIDGEHWALMNDSPRNSVGPFYVDRDRLHLLEPKVGDLVAIRVTAEFDEKEQRFIDRTYCSEVEPEMLDHSRKTITKGGAIIQRDGKPFFWPEIEEAA